MTRFWYLCCCCRALLRKETQTAPLPISVLGPEEERRRGGEEERRGRGGGEEGARRGVSREGEGRRSSKKPSGARSDTVQQPSNEQQQATNDDNLSPNACPGVCYGLRLRRQPPALADENVAPLPHTPCPAPHSPGS